MPYGGNCRFAQGMGIDGNNGINGKNGKKVGVPINTLITRIDECINPCYRFRDASCIRLASCQILA